GAAGQAIGGGLVAELLLVGLGLLEADLCVHRWFLSDDPCSLLDGHILAPPDPPAIACSRSFRCARPFIWAGPGRRHPLDRGNGLYAMRVRVPLRRMRKAPMVVVPSIQLVADEDRRAPSRHCMRIDVPTNALAAGMRNEPSGTHTSRTIMLEEIALLLSSC